VNRKKTGSAQSDQDRAARLDLTLKAALVACLWLVLYLVKAEITPTVSVATIAAVFGPDVLRAGISR
jgi:hypothetical protein